MGNTIVNLPTPYEMLLIKESARKAACKSAMGIVCRYGWLGGSYLSCSAPRRRFEPFFAFEKVRFSRFRAESVTCFAIPHARTAARWYISDATVGRILAHLVACGRARPVTCFTAAARQRRQRRTRRVTRLRGDLKANRPGDAVQVDTLLDLVPQQPHNQAVDCR